MCLSLYTHRHHPLSLHSTAIYCMFPYDERKKIDGARVLKVDSTQASFHSLDPLSQYSTYISIVYCYR